MKGPGMNGESYAQQNMAEDSKNKDQSHAANGKLDGESTKNISTDSERSAAGRPKCEICVEVESKYTCPGCSIKTCSLPCVQAHKAKLSCTGERIKTAFIDISQYSDQHLLNDYRFLEDAERSLYSNKMVPQNKQRMHMAGPFHMNRRCKLLMTAAYKRGVKLRILPPSFSKNRVNTSFFTVATDCIDWHIEWLFATTSTLLKVNDAKVRETAKLIDAVCKFTNTVEFPHLRKSLEGFNKDNISLCQFLLKMEGLPANMPRYFKLRPDSTIADNLKGHSLTEYPCIHVLPQDHDLKDFQILSKEDMTHMHPESARHMLSHHPELSMKEEMEAKLLNPGSSVYRPAEKVQEAKSKSFGQETQISSSV